PPTPENHPLPLHDALPILRCKTPHRQCRTPIVTRYGPKRCPLAHTAGYGGSDQRPSGLRRNGIPPTTTFSTPAWSASGTDAPDPDRKSTRLNSSHVKISYA